MGEQIADRYNPTRQLKVNEDGSVDTNLQNDGTMVSSANPLPVSMDSDVQIGAVEIKDGTTDARAKVKTDGTDNAQVVYQNIQPLPTGAATSDNQTNGTQKTIITDGTDDADVIATNGNKGLVTISPGHISTDNSTSQVLNPAEQFVGEWEDITNFGIIVITVKSSHASLTDGLEVEFSSDMTNIDSVDNYTVPAGVGKTFSFQAATKYFRVKYTNSGTLQSYFRLQTILKPYYVKPSSHRITDPIIGDDDAELMKSVLTGLNPDGVFTNVETTYDNSLKTSLIDGETGTRAEVEPLGALKTETPVRLVGTTFSNGTKDTNFWSETGTINGGSVTQSGQITLSTNTTANGTAKYYTVRKARKITGTTNQFRCVAGLTTDPQADNIRRIGAYDANEGFFFQANGTTMQVGSRKSASDTLVSSGSFNGNYGTEWNPSVNTLYRLIILYTAASAKFFVNGTLLHTIVNTVTGYTNTLTLPVTMENINSGGNTTNNGFVVQFATILRLGNLITNGNYYYAGTVATTILKYGAGVLQRVTVTDNTGTMIIYDNTAGSGTVIANLDASKTVGTMEFNSPFSNGLTIVTTGPPKMTVIYE